ncbi:MAG: biotin synthase BioB [Muribaculaceae bacterium]|nr:biotin synthase BioB [Muribaculaceae bacterium]
MIQTLKNKIISGQDITADEAMTLVGLLPEKSAELREAARELTEKLCSREFDSCSIVNARSGRCSENCKWCAQSAHFKTKVDVYPLISREECLRVADMNRRAGVKRFSLVTSGRKMQGDELTRACAYYKEMKNLGGLELCASMGLLNLEELKALKESGVTRYHCNLEAAPSYFHKLCSTHTIEDKIQTILAARSIGMEVCSGGIIGMGETMAQRAELALELRRIQPHSIPINILSPIPGTPLEATPLISEDEVIDTVALFRFIHPRIILRFAGGRARLSEAAKAECLRIGFNGGIVGDLLTTIGSTVESDKRMIADCGYRF